MHCVLAGRFSCNVSLVWDVKNYRQSVQQILFPEENEPLFEMVQWTKANQFRTYLKMSQLPGVVHIGSHADGLWFFHDRAEWH